VFVIFMLVEREDLRDRMIRLVSGGNYMVTTRALNDAGRRISRYMLAQSVVNGAYGLVVAVGLWLIGLVVGRGTPFPSFVLWGLLCAVLRFIPYIGPWVASAFPVGLSLAVYPGFTAFTATACLFVLLEVVSNNVMEPWLYGASTGMSTMAVLASAVFWTWLWGSCRTLAGDAFDGVSSTHGANRAAAPRALKTTGGRQRRPRFPIFWPGRRRGVDSLDSRIVRIFGPWKSRVTSGAWAGRRRDPRIPVDRRWKGP
jgi:hypothetical protein